jgi:hypothetical protein
MTPHAAPIFDAALALPEELRADLAAKLIESLKYNLGPPSDRTSDEWVQIIKARSDSLHRDDDDLIDGETALAMIQAAVDRVVAKQ